jgi:sugar/nucleoside kinase (ribokinase family)
VKSVLGSRLSRSVLSAFDEDGQVYQKELVSTLPHSNKSILAYLNTLRKFGLIQTESTVQQGKRVVFHELTRAGWSLARFFSIGLPSDIEELTTYLLDDYLQNLVSLYRIEGLSDSAIFESLSKARSRAILDSCVKHDSPHFVLLGASASYTTVDCTKLPTAGGTTGCGTPERRTGGPTVDLALAIASSGKSVTMFSTVGNDQDGWRIISDLAGGGVDVSLFEIMDGMRTNETIVFGSGADSRMLVSVSDDTALSIITPPEGVWKRVEQSKAVYIGELFIEVAAAIAGNAKAHGIPVVYRCSPLFIEMGLHSLEPVLRNVDVVVLSRRSWLHLKQTTEGSPLAELRKVTDSAILIRTTPSGYRLHLPGKKVLSLPTKSPSSDLTEWFIVGVLEGLSESKSIDEACKQGIELEKDRLVTR